MLNSESPRITSQEMLLEEMRRVDQRIHAREKDLAERWNRLPEETVKASIAAVLPILIGNGLASGIWKLVKVGVDLVKGKKSDEPGNGESKSSILAGASKLGIFTMLKLLLNLWKGK